MPIIVGVFGLLPLILGLAAEYLVCRFLKGKWWRILPPAGVLALTALVAAGRLHVWESHQSPVTQLLFVPGLPALCALLGTVLGWQLWRWLWSPRVIWEHKKGE